MNEYKVFILSAQYILGIIINIASTSIWYNKNP